MADFIAVPGLVRSGKALPAVVRVLVVSCATVLWAWLGAGVAMASVTTTVSFTAPGVYSFTVPAGVSSISVTAVGAAGGSDINSCTGVGGEGASVSAALSVSAGEQLEVGVGAVGAPGVCGTNSGGAGGSGGGASGGSAAAGSGSAPGAGGGGASSVGLPELSIGFNSLLIVAGGGGGAGGLGVIGSDGGNAGAVGVAGSGWAGGGGAGTASAGGTPGALDSSCTGAAAGTAGAFGLGGVGGAGPIGTNNLGGSGGGGGGGGYYGGGGGGGSCINSGSGGGGGGGSSFVAQGVLTATPTSVAASVTITYEVPTAALSGSTVSFGTEPQGVATPEQTLTVTNNGSAPLIVNSAALSGTDPGDYLLDNRCQSPVAPAASCVIGVRFAPQAQGASSATLTLETNAVTQPGAVALSGTGGAFPQGPTGAGGPAGPQGPTGARGPAGKVELVTCKKVTKTVRRNHKRVHVTKQVCMTKLASGPVKFTTTAAAARATVSRAGVVYATGYAWRTHNGLRTRLVARLRMSPGRYTLALTNRPGHNRLAGKEQLTIR